MSDRGEPKKRGFFRRGRKKNKSNVIPMTTRRVKIRNICLPCDLMNSAGIIRGHPARGHHAGVNRGLCQCWCNK